MHICTTAGRKYRSSRSSTVVVKGTGEGVCVCYRNQLFSIWSNNPSLTEGPPPPTPFPPHMLIPPPSKLRSLHLFNVKTTTWLERSQV